MAPPGYAPTAPPGYAPTAPFGYVPITVRAETPNKVALWATILTGAYAATSVLGAVTAPAMVEGLKQRLADPQSASPLAGQSPASFLSIPLAIASFVLLALWMQRIRNARKARGEVVGGPPAVEWWGWFVPLANIVLPLLGMRAITKARAGMGILLGWWLAYVAAGAVSVAAAIPEFTAIDFSTGKLAHPEALNPIVGLMWASAILMVVSWVFLAMIIRVTTRRQAELS
jgi:hypothetical protein